MDTLFIVALVAGFCVLMVIFRWLNPPPTPPEDEWQKWKDD